MCGMKMFPAPCKINLSLKVLGKREDGFHEVDTLMAPLNLRDDLHFIPSDETVLVCDQPGIPLDESNLVLRAVRVFEEAAGRKVGYEIQLKKRVPHGAGLGGGSSDAATTLMALNELEDTGFSAGQLIGMSAGLGSDVGFFIHRCVCRCTGRGEIVTPVPDLDGFKAVVLLVKPGFSVSTPDAYARWGERDSLPGGDPRPQHYGGVEFVNDLERPVFGKFLILPEIRNWLLDQKGVELAMMSGSGSTMFAVIDSIPTGKRLAAKARGVFGRNLWTWVAKCGA